MPSRHLITPALPCALALALAGCGSSSHSNTQSSAAAPTTSSATSSAATSSAAASSGGGATTTTNSTTIDGGPRIGFEGVPLEHGPELAPASTTSRGTVNGISCKPGEQLVYHIHAHLAVFDNGILRPLPAGVGIPGSQTKVFPQYGPVAVGGDCYFWLHTHTTDGVIHVESPERKIFTLGDFFDVWRQPLSADRVASVHGAVSAFVNGKPWHKSPRAIPLVPHATIQLEIGQPAPPLVTVDWRRTKL